MIFLPREPETKGLVTRCHILLGDDIHKLGWANPLMVRSNQLPTWSWFVWCTKEVWLTAILMTVMNCCIWCFHKNIVPTRAVCIVFPETLCKSTAWNLSPRRCLIMPQMVICKEHVSDTHQFQSGWKGFSEQVHTYRRCCAICLSIWES